MAKLPYMRLYVNDLFGDTQTLSDAEFGSYVAIIMAMWKAGGWLTLDQARKASRAPAGRWSKRWGAVAGYFEVEADGRITHARVREDLLDVGRLDDTRSKGAPAETKNVVSAQTTNSGPNPLESNDVGFDPSRALAQRQKSEGTGQKESPPLERAGEPANVVAIKPAGDWPDGGCEVWMKRLALMSHGLLDVAKNPRLTDSSFLVAQWHLNGFSFSLDVLPAIVALTKRRKEPISGWEYFNRAIRERFAKRMGFAAPVTGDDITPQHGDHDDPKLARKNANIARAFAAAQRVAESRGD